MARKVIAVAGSLLFFCVAPATIAGLVPYVVSHWEIQPPLLGLQVGRFIGAVLVALGFAGLVECFARFAVKGQGTSAPIVPTEELIVSGLYRYLRNPMYLAVLFLIVGQALLLGCTVLLQYAGVVWLLFQAFVLLYEEPVLRRHFGASYEAYRVHVSRWWPRFTPWPGSGGQ